MTMTDDLEKIKAKIADLLAEAFPSAAADGFADKLAKVNETVMTYLGSIAGKYLESESTRTVVDKIVTAKDEEIKRLRERLTTDVGEEDGEEVPGRKRPRQGAGGSSSEVTVKPAVGEGPDIEPKQLTKMLIAADTSWTEINLWTRTTMTPELSRVIIQGMTKGVVEKEKHKPTQESLKAALLSVEAELTRAATAKERVRYDAVRDVFNRFWLLWEADHLVTSATGNRAARGAALAAGSAILSPAGPGMTEEMKAARTQMNTAAVTAASGLGGAFSSLVSGLPGGGARALFGAAGGTYRGPRGGPRGGFRSKGGRGGSGGGFFGRCFTCGEQGHRATACPSGGGDGAEDSMVATDHNSGAGRGGGGRGGRGGGRSG